MGLFMAPGLPLLNLVKLVAIFYIKSWAVLVTNVPHEIVFKVLTILLSIFCKMNIRNLSIITCIVYTKYQTLKFIPLNCQ